MGTSSKAVNERIKGEGGGGNFGKKMKKERVTKPGEKRSDSVRSRKGSKETGVRLGHRA